MTARDRARMRSRLPAGDAEGRRMRTLEAWYDHIDVEQLMELVRHELAEGRLAKKEARQAKKDVAKARTRDSLRVFAKRADEIDGELRIVADPPLVVPLEDLVGRLTTSAPRTRGVDAFARDPLPALAGPPAPSDRGVRVRPHRAQGGRCRQRRYPRLDPPLRRPRRAGPTVSPVEGGAAVGARAVSRQERARRERPAGGRRPAADASGQRHLPRLAPRHGARRRDARLLRAPAPRLEGRRRRRRASSCRDDALCPTLRSDPRPRPRPLGRSDRDRLLPRRGRRLRSVRSLASPPRYADQNDRDYETFTAAVDKGRLKAQAGL